VKIKLQPFLFSRADLQALAEALLVCADGNALLVQLMQQIHRFRDAETTHLLPSEIDYFSRLAARLEAEVALVLYVNLLASGTVVDGYLDLEGLSQACRIKNAHGGALGEC
jgi:hypothetical protein